MWVSIGAKFFQFGINVSKFKGEIAVKGFFDFSTLVFDSETDDLMIIFCICIGSNLK